MKTFIPTEKHTQGIDMTPLIDVVFILLLFFVLTSSFADPALPLNLPESASSNQGKDPDIQIAIDANGMLFANSDPTDQEKLKIMIKRRTKGEKRPSISLQADQDTAYKDVFVIIDMLKAMKVTELQLSHTGKQ